jgi:glycosyltransferase involved in cell wall biosynthesis
VSKAAISAIPLAVAEAPPPPDRAEFCRRQGLPPDAKLIITAGRMDTRASLLDAVWAFEFLRYIDPAIRLLVIGDGPGREGTESAARAAAPEGSRVHFLGARADVPAVLGLADLVLVPQGAGGANVALEAMAAGRAVIAADTADLAAVVRHDETGVLVAAGDSPAMAKAMRRLLLDPDWRERLGEMARRDVRQMRAIATVVQTLETVYRD